MSYASLLCDCISLQKDCQGGSKLNTTWLTHSTEQRFITSISLAAQCSLLW